MKNIVISFDGTWNTPNESGDVEQGVNTNVYTLFEAVLDRTSDHTEQQKHYIAGVGTRWYNRIRGGAFGVGLDANIKAGYARLIDLYEDGDQVFVLGFSRGAYSARSLVGMIRNVGLLHVNRRREIHQAYELYRTRDEGADSPSAQTFRAAYSRSIPIHCLGVWDTVGALGVPLRSFGWFNARRYEFHDTELSGIVGNAFHALAIDEHRSSYPATVWDPRRKPQQRIEQVWFPGAHADVGGGYRDHRLADLALHWMAERLIECGLGLDRNQLPAIGPQHHGAEIHDSFALFMKGMYQRFSDRSYRTLGGATYGNEKLDDSVDRRLQTRKDYTPRNPVRPHLKGTPGAIAEDVATLRDVVAPV